MSILEDTKKMKQQQDVTLMECCMYEKEFPDLQEFVMVTVDHISDIGAEVSLLEYNGVKGLVLLSDLSKSRIRSVNNLIRVGKQEIMKVIRVDSKKGYIDLSKKHVEAQDYKLANQRYEKSKVVHKIVRNISMNTKVQMIDVYKMFVWSLYEKYTHAYDA